MSDDLSVIRPTEELGCPPALPKWYEEDMKRPWGFWMTLLWGFVALMASQMLAGVIVLGMYVSAHWGENMENFQSPGIEQELMGFMMGGEVLFAALVPGTIVGCLLCWVFGRMRRGFSGGEYLGLVRFSIGKGLLWLLVFGGLIFGVELLPQFQDVEKVHESAKMMVENTRNPLFLFLAVTFCAAFGEEYVFRGILHTGWRESRIGVLGSAILTSFLWTIIHVQYFAQPQLLVYLFLMGLVLTYAREKTGSLWVPIGLHFLNNLVSVIMAYQYAAQ